MQRVRNTQLTVEVFILAMYCLQELPQPFPKYLAPPGTTVPAEYMQVIPPYTQLNDIVQQYSCKIYILPLTHTRTRTYTHTIGKFDGT